MENYFNDLREIDEKVNLSSTDIRNCDETGLKFEHCPVKVVAEFIYDSQQDLSKVNLLDYFGVC